MKIKESEDVVKGKQSVEGLNEEFDSLLKKVSNLSIGGPTKDVHVEEIKAKKEEEEFIERGPTPKYRYLHCKTPYDLPGNLSPTANECYPINVGESIPVEYLNFPANVFDGNEQDPTNLFDNITAVSSSSSQLLLSGGTQLSPEVLDEINKNNIVEFLKADDPLIDIFADFDVEPLLQDDSILEYISELQDEFSKDIGSRRTSDDCFTSDLSNSVFSPGSSGFGSGSPAPSDIGFTLSPASTNLSPSTLAPDSCESDSGCDEGGGLLSSNQSYGNTSPVQFPESEQQHNRNSSQPTPIPASRPTSFKDNRPKTVQRPIRPKFDASTNKNFSSNTKTPSATVHKTPKSFKSKKEELLNQLNQQEGGRDKLHKKILRLAQRPRGLTEIDTEGKNYLHVLIASEPDDYVTYFIYLLDIWINKNSNTSLKGGKIPDNLQSFIDAKDNSGKTPLFYCTMLKKHKLAAVLLEFGANPNIPENEIGDTPLHWASQRGLAFKEVIDVLSTCSAIDMNQPNKKGERPLHQAIRNHLLHHKDENLGVIEVIDSKPIIEKLLRTWSKLAVQDENGKSPLHLTVSLGNIQILKLLRNYSNDMEEAINLQDNDGCTVLHEAMKTQLPDEKIRKDILVELIISCKADASVKDNRGNIYQSLVPAK